MANDIENTNHTMTAYLASNSVKQLGETLHLSNEQIMKANSAALQLEQNSVLRNCDKLSLIRYCYEVARYDFSRDDCVYPIPYGSSVQAQVGYQGYKEIAMRSKRYKNILANMVTDKDKIIRNRMTGNVTVDFDDKYDPNSVVVGYYAIALDKNGEIFSSYYMSKEQIVAHGKKWSKTYNGPAWQNSFDRMALKTVIRYLCKALPTEADGTLKALTDLDMAVISKDGKSYADNPFNDVNPMGRPIAKKAVDITPEGEVLEDKSSKELDSIAQDTIKNTPSASVEEETHEKRVNTQTKKENAPKGPEDISPADFLGEQAKESN
jgi:recombination protein RecT